MIVKQMPCEDCLHVRKQKQVLPTCGATSRLLEKVKIVVLLFFSIITHVRVNINGCMCKEWAAGEAEHFENHVNRNSSMGLPILDSWVAIQTTNMTVICVKVNLLKVEDKIEEGACVVQLHRTYINTIAQFKLNKNGKELRTLCPLLCISPFASAKD